MCSTGLRGLLCCFVKIAAFVWLLAEVCYAMIVAVARLPHCLLVIGPLLIPPRPAPLLSDGTSDSEEPDFEPTSSENEASFTATRPAMEDTALRRYGAALDRQGYVFNGVPLENRGGGELPLFKFSRRSLAFSRM